jgi:hypothetical protein
MVSRQAKGLVSTNDGRRHTFYSKEKKKSNWTMDRTGINPNEEKSDMSLRPTEQLTCQKEGSTQFYV